MNNAPENNLLKIPLKQLRQVLTPTISFMVDLTNGHTRLSLNPNAHGVEAKIIHNGRVYQVEVRDLGPSKESA